MSVRGRRRSVGAAVAGVAVLALAGCAAGGYPPSVLEGTKVTVAWNDAVSSVNAASVAGFTDANLEVAQLTRSQFARERAGRIEFDTAFGAVAIEDESAESFTLSYDLETPQWSDGVALDAADLLLAWAAGSNYFAPDAESDLHFESMPTGMVLSDEIPEYDEFERRIEVHFTRPFNGWETALDVAVPAHVVGSHALGVDDPMAAKTAVIDAITEHDEAALAKIAALWNSGFALDADHVPTGDLLLSSGPYLVEEIEGDADDPEQRVALRVNAAYVAEKTASYERIVLQRDDRENLEAAIGAEYDIAQVVPRAENFDSIRQLDRNDYGVDDIDHGVLWTALANTAASGPLSDSVARSVFMRSFDRGDTVSAAVGAWGDAYPSVSSVIIPPGTDDYQVAVEDTGFAATFRSGDAEDLRVVAGLSDGIRICVLYDRGSAVATGMYASLKAQVAEGGWIATDCGSDMPEEVAATSDNWDVYLGTRLFPETAEEIAAQWGTGGAQNHSGAADAARDELIAQLAAETDRYEARDLRVAIERTIVGQMVVAPLTVSPVIMLSNRGIEGIEPRSSRHGTLLDRAIGWRPEDAPQPSPSPSDDGDDLF